jgi:hypothetical protein
LTFDVTNQPGKAGFSRLFSGETSVAAVDTDREPARLSETHRGRFGQVEGGITLLAKAGSLKLAQILPGKAPPTVFGEAT